MSRKIDPNIEELLNSFIDGELTVRQQTEVQRLVAHDPQIAKRLQQLQKTRLLVSSLPLAEAPAGLAERIKATLQGEPQRAEPAIERERIKRRTGTWHLLGRRVLAAAAMIGLVAILAAVVYTIVMPRAAQPPVGFDGRLELKTTDLVAVNEAINKAIKDKGLLDSATLTQQQGKNVYALTCSRQDLNSLLAGLADVWRKSDSAILSVKTPLEQTFEGTDAEGIVKIARDLITIPKPNVIGERPVEKPVTPAQDVKKVHLTIVVAGSK